MNAVILSESDSEELEHTSMYKQPIFIQPSDHITSSCGLSNCSKIGSKTYRVLQGENSPFL